MDWNDVIFHQGNEELQRFIELGVLAAGQGIPFHFHVEGVRGTGKTTLIRAAQNSMPKIERVRGCLYNCDPAVPHCPQHGRSSGLEGEQIPLPFLEVSHSAKVGTVVGSIDLDRLTSSDSPSAALLPGTLPRAHRGIVFVDEINRLADTSPALVDILLDAMGTKPGRLQIEESGLPTVEMPLKVSVWAASNPDEEPGPLQEIRRQLADRFDFAVRIERPDHPDVVRAIMNAGNGVASPSVAFPASFPFGDCSGVTLTERLEEFLGEIYIRFHLESIRGIQAARLGSILHAARYGKVCADFFDLAAVLPAALRHRVDPPKLLEISEAMKTAVLAERKNEENRQASRTNPVAEEKQPVRRAFWRGLWQRFSGQQVTADSKEVTAKADECPARDNPGEIEKKKHPVLTGQEGTGKL